MQTPRPLSREEAICSGIFTGAGVSFLLKSEYLGHQVKKLYPVINANIPQNNALALFLIGAAPAYVYDRVQERCSAHFSSTKHRHFPKSFKINATKVVSVGSAIATSIFIGYGFDQSARTSLLTSALGSLIFYAIKSAILFREKEKNNSQLMSPLSSCSSSSSRTHESSFGALTSHPLNQNGKSPSKFTTHSPASHFSLSSSSSSSASSSFTSVSPTDEPASPSSPISRSPKNRSQESSPEDFGFEDSLNLAPQNRKDTATKSPRPPLSISVGSPDTKNPISPPQAEATKTSPRSPSIGTDAISDELSLVPDTSASSSSAASSLSAPLNRTPLLVATPPKKTPGTSTKIELTDINTKVDEEEPDSPDSRGVKTEEDTSPKANAAETHPDASQVEAEEDDSPVVSADVDADGVKRSPSDEQKPVAERVDNNVRTNKRSKKKKKSRRSYNGTESV